MTVWVITYLATSISNHQQPLPKPDLPNEFIRGTYEDDTFIPISTTDEERLYEPWKYSVIIKLFGRRIAHHLLKNKLIEIWKPTEELPIIDLGSDFFLIKFQQEENMLKALQGGPWFILNHFLSVRKWEPKFIASSTQLIYSAIWVRLPELPTEFYDVEILQRVGSKLGHLLKIDTCTSATTRGRYARICIEVPLERPLKTYINIGNHRQDLLYEGINILCTSCDHLGHTIQSCPHTTQTIKNPQTNQPSTSSAKPETEWRTVIFPKKMNSSYKPRQSNITTNTPPLEQPPAHLLPVIPESNEITVLCKHNDYSPRDSSTLTPSQSIPLEPSLFALPLKSLDTNITDPLTNITPILPSSENTHNAETNFHQQ
ncbi:PREDICTED: uncharacterized protein At4g02000-like [Nicotiana attenuata]|uniref:uncharacterized protein At4g02000-like n=1 Tax=Nicotiana attenuata TaxID=49451 RepID=UPI000904A129|nr:PREDICTED: uncharacterized protein At4g02000-like [Nicotiana attenuata]